MGRAYGIRSQLAVAFESTYGTPPSGNWYRMPFYSSTLSAEQPLIENRLLGYGRSPLQPVQDMVSVDGEIVVPVELNSVGVWLRAFFGPMGVSGTGPFTHTVIIPRWDIPSLSIEIGTPEVPRYFVYSGCRVESLRWQMQTSGLLQATVRLVGQGETQSSSSSAGSPTPPGNVSTQLQAGHFHGAILRSSNSLGNIVSADITISNNLSVVKTIRNDAKIDGADPTILTCTGQIVARFADTTLLQQAINNTPAVTEFKYDLPGAAILTILFDNVFLQRPRLEIQGPDGIQVTFPFQASSVSPGGLLGTVSLTNDVSAY